MFVIAFGSDQTVPTSGTSAFLQEDTSPAFVARESFSWPSCISETIQGLQNKSVLDPLSNMIIFFNSASFTDSRVNCVNCHLLPDVLSVTVGLVATDGGTTDVVSLGTFDQVALIVLSIC